MLKKSAPFFLFLFLFHSCYKLIRIDLPEYEGELFVLGIIEPDSTVGVSVSRTVPLDEPDEFLPYLEGAEVVLYENGIAVDTLGFDVTVLRYTGDYIPNDSSEYRIEVKHDGRTATGQTRFTAPPDVELISLRKTQVPVNGFFEEVLEVQLLLRDNVHADYYAIQIKEKNQQGMYALYLTETSLNDPVVLNEAMYFDDEVFFSDELFKNEDYTLTLHYGLPSDGAEELIIEIFGLERYAYLFYKYLQTGYDGPGVFGGEPSAMPDNIEGGLGVFSSRRKTELSTMINF